MTDLKTLKDIDLNVDDIHDWNKPGPEEALKKEAIKWIKHIQEDIKQLHEIESKPQFPLGRMATQGLDEVLEGQIKWIKMFFNISEEDLR